MIVVLESLTKLSGRELSQLKRRWFMSIEILIGVTNKESFSYNLGNWKDSRKM